MLPRPVAHVSIAFVCLACASRSAPVSNPVPPATPSVPVEVTDPVPAPTPANHEPIPPASSSVSKAPGLTITGTVKGTLPPETVIAVLWHVPHGHERMFLAAEARATGDSFTVNLPRGPEPEHVIRETLGVGIVVALQPGTAVPTGGLDRATFEALTDRMIGAATRQAVVFRGASSTLLDRIPWLKGFDHGLHCGEGIPPHADAVHEGFAPVTCDAFEIVLGPFSELRSQFVDWT